MILRSDKGFSIVQMLIVAGILSIILFAFADLIIGMQKEVGRMKRKQDRVISNHVINQALTSNIGIRGSAELLPENEMLKACILGGATSSCTTNCCNGQDTFEFFLLDPRDSTVEAKNRARLGGTKASPAYFDQNSNSGCTPPGCMYRVLTKFKARCPGGVTSCSHSESLSTTVEIIPEAGKESMMKAQTRSLIYFVDLNYQPFISTIASQSVAVNSEITRSVYGNSGHPSEVQNFIFEKCESADSAIATVTCYGFMNAVGTIKIDGVAAGITKVKLQINDGGLNNQLSEVLEFEVQVTP